MSRVIDGLGAGLAVVLILMLSGCSEQSKEFFGARSSEKEVAQLLQEATKGDANAQHRIGVRYVLGMGVPVNFGEAMKWFRKAADQGHAQAQFSVGLRYLRGESVPRDATEAAKWFRKAANQGVEYAQFGLGQLYARGDGVPQDDVESYVWLALAGPYKEPKYGTNSVEGLSQRMSPAQIQEAQRRVKAFVPTRSGSKN